MHIEQTALMINFFHTTAAAISSAALLFDTYRNNNFRQHNLHIDSVLYGERQWILIKKCLAKSNLG